MRIMFLGLWFLLVLGSQVRGEVEIYVNGQKYNSLQAYQASKKSTLAQSPKGDKKSLPGKDLHKLYVLSVEKGVVDALHDFYQTWGQSDFPIPTIISSEQLQGAIKKAVTMSKDPKLLISEPGKVRIMSISPDNSKQ